MIRLSRWLLVLLALSAPQAAHPQDSASKPRKPNPFFEREQPLAATLIVNMKTLRGDKGDAAPWRSASMIVPKSAPDTGTVTIPLKVKTRGIWRLKTCDFPPIRLNFTGAAVKKTAFHGLDKPKLVSYCRNSDEFEQYVLSELQLYRAYQLLTPASHKARLVRLSYIDSGSTKPFATRYAFLLDDVDDMAARADGKIIQIKGARGHDLDPRQSALFGVFEYFVGNTDFSVSGLHNVELISLPLGIALPVAHDFDFSGAVNARYATPDAQLKIRTVRDRLYRGYCTDPKEFQAVFDLFNQKKAAIYALYQDDIGKLIQPGTVRRTLEYFDDFYKTINKPADAKDAIVEACIPSK